MGVDGRWELRGDRMESREERRPVRSRLKVVLGLSNKIEDGEGGRFGLNGSSWDVVREVNLGKCAATRKLPIPGVRPLPKATWTERTSQIGLAGPLGQEVLTGW